MRIILCDNCGQRMESVIVGADGGDYCSMACSIAANGADGACAHDDNIDATTHGMEGRHLICRDCGYDRVEAVEGVTV